MGNSMGIQMFLANGNFIPDAIYTDNGLMEIDAWTAYHLEEYENHPSFPDGYLTLWKPTTKTHEELDNELEDYHFEAHRYVVDNLMYI